MNSKRSNQKGVSLILALILVLVLSVLGVSIMFLSRSETWSSMNYRMMTQARYGAEAGLHKAANYIIYSYTPPGTAGDPMSNYVITKSPVQTTGSEDVVLSSVDGIATTYPVSSVQDAFNTATQGTLAAGNTGVGYSATATLISMRQVAVYGSPIPRTIQTWRLTARGTINNVQNAQVEVSTILERQITPVPAYAAFGVYDGCGALKFSGGGTTDSYDSGGIVLSGGSVVTDPYGGNVGANGNLNENGAPTTIYGTMSTPRTGVGNCSSGGVNAWTDNGNAQVTGGLVQLPQTVTYPLPDAPDPMPPTTNDRLRGSSTDCGGLAGCSGANGNFTLSPGQYGNLDLTGGVTIHLTAGTYNLNSISMSGNSKIIVDSGPIILNVAGQGISGANATVVDLTGGTLINSTLNPANLQIVYGGTAQIAIAGNSQAAGIVYAPAAYVKLTGGSDWFGAIIGYYVEDAGGTHIHYDRRLQTEYFTIGNYMLDSFSWSKN